MVALSVLGWPLLGAIGLWLTTCPVVTVWGVNADNNLTTPSNPGRPHSGMTPAASAPIPAVVSRVVITLLALACGTAVANLYYVQPLLNLLAQTFAVSQPTAGLLVTCSQLGYMLGLLLVVPLCDLLERRRLITGLLVGAAAADAACAAAPSFSVLAAALATLGGLSVVAQIVVPLAATLASPQQRGQVIGTVMSGLLIGILLARTFSGLIAALGGWRLVFALAAAVMLALSLALHRKLPIGAATPRLHYSQLLRSVLALIIQEPVLRQRMALGALAMAGFSVLWTCLPFLLGGRPYHYSEATIGLFGLAGLTGALAAPLVGRLADRGYDRHAVGALLFTTLASWALLAAGHLSLPALVAGLLTLDLGIQGVHINNQHAIYRLQPAARSRLTTAYMVSFFLGGVIGSLLSTITYGIAGWTATCLLGAVIALTACTIWATTHRISLVRQVAPNEHRSNQPVRLAILGR
jgi:predicted MFS family arabinose efflux permease